MYYVLATDENQEWAGYAEEDTFYCFSILMEEMVKNK
jgi:hypothetical protein